MPECKGDGCSHFSDWLLYGVLYGDTTENKLYVVFDNFGITQQVEIYSDPYFFNLIAIGQGTSGFIDLYGAERPSVYGAVKWDGVPVHPDQHSILYCLGEHSSQSSSSLDSSSSSSISSQSESSTSEGCCVNFGCYGDSCHHFSGWELYNVNEGNSDNCYLYIRFFVFGGEIQQILFYKDENYFNLVAISQRKNSGVMPIEERNGSGIYGNVTWDGSFISYPEHAIISCYEFSSNSSYSTSGEYSSSSTSRSTSSSYSSSSSSSEIYSFSSLSSSTSSYSSSSSSSESFLNISSSSSTSSSSSILEWNEMKPLELGISAVDNGLINNRIAQSIYLYRSLLRVGKVYLYFYAPQGDVSGNILNLSIYHGDQNGVPQILISSKSIFASSVNINGWYYFDFGIDIEVSDSKYVVFVFWQSGNSDSNYILWGYDSTDDLKNISWISPDGQTWCANKNVMMSLRIADDFNPYDLENFRIAAPSSIHECVKQGLTDGDPSYDDTQYLPATGDYDRNKVVIKYPKIMASFIVDGSGSMGWSDRWNSRVNFLKQYIDRLVDNYPAEVLIDILTFGGVILDIDNIYNLMGNTLTINLDIRKPTRTTYLFTTLSEINVSQGDVYTHNGGEYVVTFGATGGNTLICMSDTVPLNRYGTLDRVIGTGDVEISFSDYSDVTVDNSLIYSYGFKKFDPERYSIANLMYDDVIFHDPSTNFQFWSIYHGDDESPVINLGDNGPNSAPSIDIDASNRLSIRNLFSNSVTDNITELLDTVYQGGVNIRVNNPEYFLNGDKIQIMDGYSSSSGHTVMSVDKDSGIIEISPPLYCNIYANNIYGGIVRTDASSRTVDFSNNTTLKMEIFAPNGAGDSPLTFFIETDSGYRVEWDFTVDNQWRFYTYFNLFDPSLLVFRLFDDQGDPLPDGTELNISVDKPFKGSPPAYLGDRKLIKDSRAGTYKLYLDSVSGFSIGTSFYITSEGGGGESGKTQIGYASDIDENSNIVTLKKPLLYDFKVVRNSKVRAYGASFVMTNLESSAYVHMADITPFYSGKELSPELLEPYDTKRCPPGISYDDIYETPQYVSINGCDMASIEGSVIAHIMPITDDIVKNIGDKEEDVSGLFNYLPERKFTSQLIKSDEDREAIDIFKVTTTTTTLGEDFDYTIETPIYSRDGYAESEMISYSTELSQKVLPYFNSPPGFPQEYFCPTKEYTIYPVIVVYDRNQKQLANYELEKFKIEFIPSVLISSEYTGEEITFYGFQRQNCAFKYDQTSLRGVYSYTDETFSIEYTCASNGVLIKSGEIIVRVYVDRFSNIDSVCQQLYDHVLYLLRPPESSESNIEGILPSEQQEPPSPEEIKKYINASMSWLQVNKKPLEETRILDNGTIETYIPLSGIEQWRNKIVYNSEKYIDDDGEFIDEPNEVEESPVGISGDSEEINLTGGVFNWYDNLSDKITFAAQYGYTGEIRIPIVNGKASLSFAKTDVVGIVFIEAVLSTDVDKEYVRNDVVICQNPITVSPFNSPLFVQDETERYDLIASVKWAEGRYENEKIPDNTKVIISPVKTIIEPSISSIINEQITGCRIGPHAFVRTCEVINVVCPWDRPCYTVNNYYLPEFIHVSVFHPDGLVKEIDRGIVWMSQSQIIPDDGGGETLHIHADVSDTEIGGVGALDRYIWAEGSFTPSYGFYSYLYDGFNDKICYLKSLDNVHRIDGMGQPEESPRPVYVKDFGLISNGNQIIGIYPTNTVYYKDSIVSYFFNCNASLGHTPNKPVDGDKPPWYIYYYPSTSFFDQNGQQTLVTHSNLCYPAMGAGICTCDPLELQIKDPLGIEVFAEINGYEYETLVDNDIFYRDGVQSPTIVAYATWKDKPITKSVTINGGHANETVINYPLPNVYFHIGEPGLPNRYCEGMWPNQKCCIIDDRVKSYLTVKNNDVMQLSSFVVQVSNVRTTLSDGMGGVHRHKCVVSDDGNGYTTDIIKDPKEGAGSLWHSHDIINYIVQPCGGIAHIHELASASEVTMSPLSQETSNLDVVIQAFVEYDPTNCLPYVNYNALPGLTWKPEDTWEPINGNRMMSNTIKFSAAIPFVSRDPYLNLYAGNKLSLNKENEVLIAEGGEIDDSLVDIQQVDGAGSYVLYCSRFADDIEKSLDIRAEAGYTGYTYEDKPGHYVYIPPEKISDGSRISLSCKTRGYMRKSTDNSIASRNIGEETLMMEVVIEGNVCIDGKYLKAQATIMVVTTIPWLPSVKSLTPSPINDNIYFYDSYNKIESMGSSQLYDAIKQSSRRLIDYQFQNKEWEDSRKIIIAVSDGDENASTYSFDQAINSVKFIDRKNESPVISMITGLSHPLDSVIMEKISVMTGGSSHRMINTSDLEITRMINDIISGGEMGVNTGIYGNIQDLGINVLLENVLLEDYYAKIGSKILFRQKYSIDSSSWSLWSEWRDVNETITFVKNMRSVGKYIEYQVRMFGNSFFETPEIYSGIKSCYYNPRSLVVFFSPVDLDISSDEYVSSINITHTASPSDLSTIQYGFCHVNSIDIDDYFSVSQPLIEANQHAVILSRYNEPIITNNYYTRRYIAVNGRWPSMANISIYRINSVSLNGVLVNASEYIANSIDGSIIFNSIQPKDDQFVICVDIEPSFRTFCKIVNYDDSVKIIDHIGMMYNVAKRVPRDIHGNIINTPFYSRIQI